MPPMGVVVFASGHRQTGCMRASAELTALEHVANRPIAHHVLDSLIESGVEEVVMVGTADDLLDVRRSLREYPLPPGRVEWAACPKRYDVVKTLRAAAPHVGSARCVAHLGDGLLGEPLGPHLDAQ